MKRRNDDLPNCARIEITRGVLLTTFTQTRNGKKKSREAKLKENVNRNDAKTSSLREATYIRNDVDRLSAITCSRRRRERYIAVLPFESDCDQRHLVEFDLKLCLKEIKISVIRDSIAGSTKPSKI